MVIKANQLLHLQLIWIFGVIVVRHVPAEVCEQCGAEWINDSNAEQLDQIVNYAKEKHTMIEVSEFSAWKKVAS